MKKILIYAVIIIIAAFISLTTLSCSNNKQNNNKRQVTITFWHSFVSSTIPALNKLIAQFEKIHPGIKIQAEYIPSGDALIQKLITAVKSNTAPDISWLHSDFMEDLVEAHAIYKMNHFIKGPNGIPESDLQDIYPALMRYASWHDTLYSMPMEATDLALLYNKDMFRKAGLDPNHPPQTWDELYNDAKKLTIDKGSNGNYNQVGFFLPIYPAAGPRGAYMVWQWMPFLWQGGGYMINPQQTKVLFNSQAGVQALTLWKKIYVELHLSTFTADYDVAFVSKHLAMAMDGPWTLPRYRNLLKGIDWAYAPLPAGPKKRATVVGGEYLAIFKQCQHPDSAWTFIKWIINPETQATWAMNSGYLPIRRAVLKIPRFQEYLKNHPNFRVFVEQMENSQAQRSIDYGGMEVTRDLAEAIESATVGNQDPKKALDAAAVKADKDLKDARNGTNN